MNPRPQPPATPPAGAAPATPATPANSSEPITITSARLSVSESDRTAAFDVSIRVVFQRDAHAAQGHGKAGLAARQVRVAARLTQSAQKPGRPDGLGQAALQAADVVVLALVQFVPGGAVAELDAAGAGYEIIAVPGALEIPQALGQAVANGLLAETGAKFAGAIALGCVIRGETSHYDIVCDNANHWMMRVAMDKRVPLGNAILTVDTHAQAMARAEAPRASCSRRARTTSAPTPARAAM